MLLSVLKGLTDSPDFEGQKHQDILDLIEKMSDQPPESSRSGSLGLSQDPGSSSSGRTFERAQTTDTSPMPMGTDDSRAYFRRAGENLVRSDIGSPDRQRELSSAVNLDAGTGMPGYVGKMSEVSWVQRIGAYLVGVQPLSYPDFASTQIDMQNLDATGIAYYTDDQNLLAIDEDYVDPHLLPPWQVVMVLTEAYFHSLQGAFHFVPREQFYQDLKNVYDAVGERVVPTWGQRSCLALANVMWAVGAKWMQMTHLEQHTLSSVHHDFSENHLVYYARARALGLDHRMQFDHPSIELIQGLAVLGLYLLANGSIQRASSLVAQAIRHATALGLHLKVTEGVMSDSELTRRSRLWWSLYRIEVLLSETTGRPKCLHIEDMTVPFRSLFSNAGEGLPDVPGNIIDAPISDNDSAEVWKAFIGDGTEVARRLKGGAIPWSKLVPLGLNMSETHFAASLELSGISDKIGSKIYLSPGDLTWFDVQSTVKKMERELEQWQEHLHQDLQMESLGQTQIDPRSSLELEMYFCSIRMILYRPFMCEIRIDQESAGSAEFNRLSARAGVTAAIRMLDVMPDDPIAADVAQVLPWWVLLQYVCRAAAMLLLEMCLNIQHMQNETKEVMAATRKALNYLWILAPESKSAYRAWNIFRPLVDKVAQRYRQNVLGNLPLDAQKPQGWSRDDNQKMHQCIAKILW
ncbi:uncharacterized protein HMPREF1541_00230 [Cyphellophora europaea CBS 101466]|uniref:Xylanolytic transcriptional activator regulatory domain-containing protein n=1 Tax=Cyphellophora europaea (strain CBS 101466) TaxID=1220924 RepID=W2SBG8_CYPE1|nr:uncharacterized protein HMPREF1541_00230 [Cyphellophora europaea CBS 101466]ETN46047.1 hypothetical protein HMPREF1541_00230 [Cyphellophora europaea CBS 101466]